MLRRMVLVGSLGLLAQSPIAAQEPRTQARNRIWINGDEVRPFDLLARRRAKLGVTLQMRGAENDSIGATIQGVTPGGPAAKAGLRSGDIVTRFNGKSLVRAERERDDRDRDKDRDRDQDRDRPDDQESLAAVRLIEMVAKLEPGDTVALEYRRGKDAEPRTARVVTSKEFAMGGDRNFSFNFPEDGDRVMRRMPRLPGGEGPNAWVMAFGGRFADLELAPVNAELGAYFGTSDGVLVINAPAKNSLGLKSGDVVLSIEGRAARGPASLLRILRSYEEGDVVKLEIMRNKSRQTITSKMTRDDEE